MEGNKNEGSITIRNYRMPKSESFSCTTDGTMSSWDKMSAIDYSNQQTNSSVISDLSSSIDILSFKNNTVSSPCSCAKNKRITSSTDSIPENNAGIMFRSNLHIYLCSDQELNKRMKILDEKKKDILPMQLSTVATAKELQHLKAEDLTHSVIKIFELKNPQMNHVRNSCLFYYNWIIVDLCRRMELVEERYIKIFQEGYGEQLRRQVIMMAANEVRTHIPMTHSFGITTDNEFFDYFAPFVPKKREQIIRVVDIFGDKICLFTESIDMKSIGDMKSEDYIAFYHDLVLCKDRLKKRLGEITETSSFTGDPCQPYSKIELLNYK
ncbi:hypothetical protein BDC45DRAFT_553696 [Circinella umbellata]|nr:hypothetical protein BDC45DRAFT_553696 [Circinella umbellata]